MKLVRFLAIESLILVTGAYCGVVAHRVLAPGAPPEPAIGLSTVTLVFLIIGGSLLGIRRLLKRHERGLMWSGVAAIAGATMSALALAGSIVHGAPVDFARSTIGLLAFAADVLSVGLATIVGILFFRSARASNRV